LRLALTLPVRIPERLDDEREQLFEKTALPRGE
jgi:hypothetical protein